MAKLVSKKAYLSAVAKKLNDPVTRRLLQFGQTWNDKVVPLRDELGMQETRNTIMRSAANAYDLTSGRVSFNQQFGNFSAGPTYEDVADVRTVGAIDLTIINMSQSLVPYLCVDRGMEAVDSTVFYNNLVAVNSAGGVSAGDTVMGNFNPPNINVDLNSQKSLVVDVAAGTVTADLGANLIQKTVSVKIVKATGEVIAVAGDYAGEGAVAGTGTVFVNFIGGTAGDAATIPASGTVDYATGVVTFAAPTGTADTTAKIQVSALNDVAKGQNAPTDNEVLIVEPQWTSIALKSTPMNIILNNNLQNMMYMAKVNAMSTGKAGNPYNDAIFQRVSNTYIEAVNNRVIRGMKASVTGIDVLTDLSTYTVGGGTAYGSFVGTKNDAVAQTIANMKAAMLAKTGCGVTAIVANSIAVAMMELVPVLFVAAPTINQGLNGLVGYFNNIPVYRHNSLDGYTATFGGTSIANTDAVMFGVYRSADNGSGSQVYGEYLPFTSTGNVNNYFMPTQNSTGFFSQIAHQVIDSRLIALGVIKGNTSVFRNWSGN